MIIKLNTVATAVIIAALVTSGAAVPAFARVKQALPT
jgi:hypothetical protein